jgi:uncharacterized coiled-coil DUF342 family protein
LRGEVATLAQSKADLEIVRAEVETRRAELADILARLQNLDEDRRRLEALGSELTQKLEQKASLEQAVLDLQRQKDELQPLVERLTLQQQDLASEIATLTQDRDRRRSEIDALERTQEALRGEIEQLRHEGDELNERTQKRSEELRRVQDECNRLQGEASALNAELDRLRAQVKSAQDVLIEATERREAMAAEVGRLRAELHKQQQALNAENDALVRAQGEVEGLRQKRDALAAEISQATAILAGLKGKLIPKDKDEVGETLLDLLKVPDALARAKRRKAALTEDQALDQVRQHMERQGLHFSRRLLDAFHTTLKISDISPLTVLAGISGTGKSELPRQYAAAIGMPFFQLAVQPRWDSPTDLFGFYNYMEHRYKPTELIRAMVYLDTRNWPKQAEAYKDHMALVLLDEMNLARVEYYFSEFLSRLEVRRDQENEPAADIELDLGHLPAEFKAKVYPTPRLLFVGTMNEDESTQTLSDKVVDRANVLRFPRPKRLRSLAPARTAEVGTDEFLPYAIWRGWRRQDDQGSRVDDWLETLNGEFEKLGRPFGHRMGKAIRAYVANHPETRQGRSAIAMADQLEMRLFPKLRGIDTTVVESVEALNRIQGFIRDELEDRALGETFGKARNAELFHWPGMDRD